MCLAIAPRAFFEKKLTIRAFPSLISLKTGVITGMTRASRSTAEIFLAGTIHQRFRPDGFRLRFSALASLAPQ